MSNLLNLDEIDVGTEKSFTFNGTTHVMKPLSVGEYVKQIKTLESMKEGESSADSIDFMVKSVRAAFPTLSKSDAEAMTFDQVDALMQHVQGDVTEEMEEGNAS
ncbi:MAG: hypothetical protein NXH70_02580 [Hyphomonas sp.]|nr:hypothetical protein [Hyphomonas sp.]